jgi:hypothetical protein
MVIFFLKEIISMPLYDSIRKKPYTVTYYYLVLIRSAIQAPGQLIILIKKHFQ